MTPKRLSPTDTQALTAIYSQYSWCFDSGRAADCAALFAPTGRFVVGADIPVIGQEALVAFFSAAASKGTGTQHFVSNIVMDSISESRARGSAYVLVLRVDEDALRLVTMGHYADDFVLIDGQWRIEQRAVSSSLPAGLANAVLTQSR